MIGIAARGAQIDVVLHTNAFVASRVMNLLGGKSGIRLIEPCSHADLIERMRSPISC